MSDLFKELRFMGLRSEDKTKVSYVVSEAALREEYNFTHFYKLEDGGYELVDLYTEGVVAELVNSPPRRHYTPTVRTLARNSIKFTSLGNQPIHLSHNDSFTKKPKGELLKVMKLWIKEKQGVFTKLHNTYFDLQQKHKKIYLLPVSFKINFSSQLDDDPCVKIPSQSKILTEAFTQLVEKVKSRHLYASFLHYSRLVLLTNQQQPFLHVLFYYQEPDISDFYIRDLTRIWCEVVDKAIARHGTDIEKTSFKRTDETHVYTDYVYFDTPLPQMRNDGEDNEDGEDWKDGHYYLNDKRYNFEVSHAHFLQSSMPRKSVNIIVPQRRKGRAGVDLKRNIEAKIKRFSEDESYFSEAEYKKWIKSIKQDQNHHTDYLEKVAKQYVKIPGVNNLTTGVFTYLPKKRKKKSPTES
ncbi:hypothetical protein [Escherichia coli]|uniref:hypothetical protein n=1 Tax=Escherichia coli TaxID=562 RepID=UPI00128F525D|nr:hypothetical protein [Escherichia coli]MQK02198.1 hypothetical protein [Escherichia coli]HAX5245491.1 hypothetical protein [Escherichia coli]HBN0250032.1 hypothetical protein [Escherichia coli]